MRTYLHRLEAVERKLTPEAQVPQVLGVFVDDSDNDAAVQAKINAAAAARGISPNAVGLKVIIVRWTRCTPEVKP